MKDDGRWTLLAAIVVGTLALAAPISAHGQAAQGPHDTICGGSGRGHHGPGHQGGASCPGCAATETDPASRPDSDMRLFRWLLDHRSEIRRTVERTPEGVVTLTESDQPEVAAGIREHVASMHRRLLEGRPIHLRDPLFEAIFSNREKIEMRIEKTDRGVRVVERSDDPWVAKLIQAHAQAVDGFLANGHQEMRRDHAVPDRP